MLHRVAQFDILKQGKDTMSDDLSSATASGKRAVADFDVLMAAKEKEIAACQKAIETRGPRESKDGGVLNNRRHWRHWRQTYDL